MRRMALPLPSPFGGATMAKILLRSGIPELRRNGPPTSDIRIHFGRAYLGGRRGEGAFGRRSLLKRGLFMSPPYGWPIAGRYCATAGFFHPLCGWLSLSPLVGIARRNEADSFLRELRWRRCQKTNTPPTIAEK